MSVLGAGAARPQRGAVWALALPAVLAVVHVCLFYSIAFARVGYPFELEWMEGGMLSMVERVREGLPLYVEPSVEYVPFIYTPLFYYVSAAVSVFAGIDFATLRLVSIACTTILFALVGWRVWRETKNPAAAILGPGFLAAAFVPTGHWFDLGRVDMLFMVFSFGGFLLARSRADLVGAAWGGVLLGLALLTKQSAVWPAAGIGLGLLVSDLRRAVSFGAGFLAAGLLPSLVADWRSDGWFYYYTVDRPSSHSFDRAKLVEFWTNDLWYASPVLCVLAACGFVALVIQAWKDRSARVEVFFFAALVGSSWTSRLHVGGWFNVNIPAFLAMSLLASRWLARTAERASHATPRPAALLGLAALALAPALHLAPPAVAERIASALHFELAMRWPDRSLLVPGPADERDGERIVEMLRDAPGPVFVMENPYLVERAGKEGHANGIALIDVLRTTSKPLEDPLMRELLQRFADHRYSLVLMHKAWPIIETWYTNTGNIEYEGKCFMPAIGPEGRPRIVYRPKP